MNLIAIHEAILFVAVKNIVKMYSFPRNMAGAVALNEICWLGKDLQAQSGCINRLFIGKLKLVDVLIVACDDGQVSIWHLHNINAAPLILQNQISSWGISTSILNTVAVSANNHLITLFDLETGQKGILAGHLHNIPCIQFSKCGKYLVSCSIDGTCKLWNAISMQFIRDVYVGMQRGWSVMLLPDKCKKRDFGSLECVNIESPLDETRTVVIPERVSHEYSFDLGEMLEELEDDSDSNHPSSEDSILSYEYEDGNLIPQQFETNEPVALTNLVCFCAQTHILILNLNGEVIRMIENQFLDSYRIALTLSLRDGSIFVAALSRINSSTIQTIGVDEIYSQRTFEATLVGIGAVEQGDCYSLVHLFSNGDIKVTKLTFESHRHREMLI